MYHNDIKHMAQNTWHTQKNPQFLLFTQAPTWDSEFFFLLQIWQLNKECSVWSYECFKWLQSSWQSIEFWGLNKRLGELIFPKTSFKIILLPIFLTNTPEFREAWHLTVNYV